MNIMLLGLRVAVFFAGTWLVLYTLYSAIRTFVLPRSATDSLTRFTFLTTRRIFGLRLRFARTYEQTDTIMALYAPLSLVILPGVWLSLILLGYTGIFWSLGVESLRDALKLSGSSLLTLGFSTADGLVKTLVSFSEAAIGLVLVALLISYLPTIYAAFSRREAAVTLLEVRAGTPPSALEMIERAHRILGMDKMGATWARWEEWFADIDETHTSLAALAFFRSPLVGRSWVVAAGAVLDAAALYSSTLKVPRDPQADLCIRAGYLALRHISDLFKIKYDHAPQFPTTPISVTRLEYDELYNRLVSKGIPLKEDREQAWRDFAGWRVNYDAPLLALATLTFAPSAPWSGDRAPHQGTFESNL